MLFLKTADLIDLNHRVNKIISDKYIGFHRISSLKAAGFLSIYINNLFTFVEWGKSTIIKIIDS